MLGHIRKLPSYMFAVRFQHVLESSYLSYKSVFLPYKTKRYFLTSPQCFAQISFSGIAKRLEQAVKDAFASQLTFTNKDVGDHGVLTKEDTKKALKMAVPWMNEKDHDIFLQHYKKDKYNLQEFSKVVSDLNLYKSNIDAILAAFFKKYDLDKSGKLNIYEIQKMVDEMHANEDKKTKLAREKALVEYDKDKDGKVSLNELKKWFWNDPSNKPFDQTFTSDFTKILDKK